jgi:hypothetical protein
VSPTAVSVDEYMKQLDHPLKSTAQQIRELILAVDDGLDERIKWNAPSFCYDGVDRVTFVLRPLDRVQLIFHRGATTRNDTATFQFVDDTGLIDWITPDRGVVSIEGDDDLVDKRDDLAKLVARWVRAGS